MGCNIGDEFVIHVSDEYDYRYKAHELKDRSLILTVLTRVYNEELKKKLTYFMKENENSLLNFTTTK